MDLLFRCPHFRSAAAKSQANSLNHEIHRFVRALERFTKSRGHILTTMAARPKKRPGSRNQSRAARTGIPGSGDRSLDEQVALFSKLVSKNPQMAIHPVWTALDSVARAVILSELGCFDKENAPDLVHAKHYQWAREDAAELRRHAGMLETFLKKQVAHDELLARRPRFYMRRSYYSEQEGRGTLRKILEIELAHLKRSVIELNRVLQKRSNWAVRAIVIAQEYVQRRADHLGGPEPVRLTPAAIADIYSLTRNCEDEVDDSDTPESIEKAIDYFRKQPENAHFIQNIEFYLEDWKKPAATPTCGN